jgi:hypothetical protein
MIQQMHAPRAAAPVVTGADAPISAATVSGAAVNGHLAGKLGDLGLNPAQVEAVLALSREVVERVVWEVVPQPHEGLSDLRELVPRDRRAVRERRGCRRAMDRRAWPTTTR